jgi:hypothetical protein
VVIQARERPKRLLADRDSETTQAIGEPETGPEFLVGPGPAAGQGSVLNSESESGYWLETHGSGYWRVPAG